MLTNSLFTRHAARTHTVLSLCIAILGLGGLGCFTASDNSAADQDNEFISTAAINNAPKKRGAEVKVRQPPQHTRQFDDAEVAYWRAMYKQNRTVPPREFSVSPKQPRNNDYGEFDSQQFAGLDMQPRLPGMPGEDIMAMMGSGGPSPIGPSDFQRRRQNSDFHSFPASVPQQNVSGSGSANSNGGNNVPARPSMSSATAQTMGVADSGLMTESRFYPIEQLVFGGEFPDLDKPEHYRLMPRDVISITVKEHPEFSGKLEIQPDGTVRVPNLSDLIRLRGMTVDEAAEELRQTLQLYIRGECIVRVQANRARGGYYFVFGDVLQPGRFPMGLEPIKLSDAVLAANWEANLSRVDADGDELGPAFPTATPRGKFIAPRTSDLANVMLVTPHRSQPVRTSHDVRQAMLGMMREDPVVKPGQIIVVPSLDPRKNASLGLEMPEAESASFGPGTGGFSTASSAARLPQIGSGADGYGYGAQGASGYGEAAGYGAANGAGRNGMSPVVMQTGLSQGQSWPMDPAVYSELDPGMMDCFDPVQRNMARAFEVQHNTGVQEACEETIDEYYGGAGFQEGAYYPTSGVVMPDGMSVTGSGGFPVATPQEMEMIRQQEMLLQGMQQQQEMQEELPRRVSQQAGESELSAMAAPGGNSRTRPGTEVSGLESGQEEVSTREVTPLRGRRLAKMNREAARAEKRTKHAQNMKDWNLGF